MNLTLKTTQNGFTLLELLTVITIVSILITIGYPTYTSYIIKTHRTHAQVALLNMATEMERYHTLNSTYQGATLVNIHTNVYSEDDQYQLSINAATDHTYLLNAVPQRAQTKDTACGTLGLNELGEKSVSGNGKTEECW